MPARARERRKSARFSLVLPVQVLHLSEQPVELEGETRDVSSVGAYFILDDKRFALGVPIEFLVSLAPRADAPAEPAVLLRCRGRVTRIDAAGEQLGVAARIDRYEFIRPAQA